MIDRITTVTGATVFEVSGIEICRLTVIASAMELTRKDRDRPNGLHPVRDAAQRRGCHGHQVPSRLIPGSRSRPSQIWPKKCVRRRRWPEMKGHNRGRFKVTAGGPIILAFGLQA
jgi:hypothetical protein